MQKARPEPSIRVHSRVWQRLLFAGGFLIWIAVSYGCSECRYDVECQGLGLCQGGRCVGFKNEPPPVGDGGTQPPPPSGCLEGETRACFSGATQSRNQGICQDGKQSCSGGIWSACVGDTKPTTEVCDGLDNDCNGQIDDGSFGGAPCLVAGQKGPCERGIQKCVNGQITCAQTTQPAAEEICGNGVDDNCDGKTDEPPKCKCTPGSTQDCYNGPDGTRGQGQCKDGKQTCGANQEWGPCLGEGLPTKEECDGVDNNCDGKIDEALERPCGSSKGTCLPGKQICEMGQWSSTCTGEVAPIPEICDGKDNNCDGAIDENLTQACTTACGSGLSKCQGGAWQACEAPNVGKEVCDNKDNDCDGQIDEKLTQACQNGCGSGIETCDRGQWINCTAPVASPEVCDGKDNDCNGKIDETLGPEKQLSQDLSLYYYGLAAQWDGKAYGVLYSYSNTMYFQQFDLTGKSLAKEVALDVPGPGTPYNLQLIWTGKEYAAYWRYYASGGYVYKFARISSTGAKLSLVSYPPVPSSTIQIAWNGLNYGIVWYERVTTPSTGYHAYFDRLNPSGAVIGPKLEITGLTTSPAYDLKITTVGFNFGVTWSQTKTGTSNSDVFFQLIDKDAKKVGSTVNVSNNASTARSYAPEIAASKTYFLVAYLDNRSQSNQIYAARLYNQSTQSVLTTRTITTTSTNVSNIVLTQIDWTSSLGEYGIMWSEYDANNKRQLWFRKLSFSGLPRNTAAQISNTTGFISTPALAVHSSTLYGAFWMDSRTGRQQLWFRGLCGL